MRSLITPSVFVTALTYAVVGVVTADLAGAGDFRRAAILSLIAWPLLVGIPAFVAALVIGIGLDRVAARRQSTAAEARGRGLRCE